MVVGPSLGLMSVTLSVHLGVFSVIALDGNNGLFPIAVGVVEIEGRVSWGFFIDNLHTLIGDSRARPLTFMTDMQKVLLTAFSVLIIIVQVFINTFNWF